MAERSASNIWSGNKSKWNGKVALMYPSDYGYSASSSYWSETNLYEFANSEAKNVSWMYKTTSHTDYEWFLSPRSGSGSAMNWQTSGHMNYAGVSSAAGGALKIRPVLNLLSTAPIDTNHTGSSSDPYVVMGS